MFENFKRTKAIKAKSNQDSQCIFSAVNTIAHHYPMGLSVYEQIAYYTLAVAYGNLIGEYPDDELPYLRIHLYYSNINSGSSTDRKLFGINYDTILKEHFDTLHGNNKELSPAILFSAIKSTINQHNEIFPEYPKSAEETELIYIFAVYAALFDIK